MSKLMSRITHRSSTLALSIVSISAFSMMMGCGVASNISQPAVQSVAIGGRVHGGEQPLQQSHVSLFLTGATGYAPSLTPVNTTTTGSLGTFSFPVKSYTCAAGQQAYVVATGGNPGISTGTDNSAIFLMAALGPCSGISSNTVIDIDEVTTVAAAYALSGFLPAGGAGMTEAAVAAGTAMPGVGTSSTNAQGLTDAFLNASNIVNSSTGLAYTTTPAGNGTVPQNVIYALADVLQSCVNTASPSSGQCPALFSAATPPTGAPVTTAPVNTLQAILNIAQYPGNNVSTIFSLITSSAAFVPTSPLTSAPNDWTIGVTYTSPLLTSGLGLGIDASDNVYVTGSYQKAASPLPLIDADLIQFTPQGAGGGTDLVTTTALSASTDNVRWIAADLNGNLWMTDGGKTNVGVFEYTPSTTALTFQSYASVDADSNNYALAVDGLGDVWTADYKKSTCTGAGSSAPCTLVELAKGATPAYSPFITFGGNQDVSADTGGARGIAFDVNTGNVWTTSIDGSTVNQFKVTPSATGAAAYAGTSTTVQLGTSASSDATNNYGAVSVAVDNASNAWVVVAGGAASTSSKTPTSAVPAALYKVVPGNSTGTAVSNVAGTAAAGGGLASPAFLAIDGNNNIFVANTGASTTTSSVVEYSPGFNSNAGAYLSPNVGFSPSATYSGGALSGGSIYQASYVAVDRSGSLWVLSSGTGQGTSLANIVQILGVAAPTNPVLAAGQYGVKP